MDAKIKKNFRFRMQSQCAWFGEIKAQHVLPNKFVLAIDPFVFLKHILSIYDLENQVTLQEKIYF